jgi:MYXO-CTERM domain-containing protein
MNELSSGTETRLGPMINRTFPVIADLEFGRDTIEIYHLLGDPALRVAKADESAGTGGQSGTPGTGGASGSPGNGGPGLPSDGLTTAGCSVGSSRHDAPVLWFMLIGAVALLLRKRNAKRRSRR